MSSQSMSRTYTGWKSMGPHLSTERAKKRYTDNVMYDPTPKNAVVIDNLPKEITKPGLRNEFKQIPVVASEDGVGNNFSVGSSEGANSAFVKRGTFFKDICKNESLIFNQCIDSQMGDVGKCQSYADALSQCKQINESYTVQMKGTV